MLLKLSASYNDKTYHNDTYMRCLKKYNSRRDVFSCEDYQTFPKHHDCLQICAETRNVHDIIKITTIIICKQDFFFFNLRQV